LREAVAESRLAAIDASRAAADLKILAAHYDAVLLDLGPLEAAASGAAWPGAVCQGLDAVLLVQNVRATTPNRVEDLQQKLAAAGVAHAGTIQNFVAR
jgi:hypothetical protein